MSVLDGPMTGALKDQHIRELTISPEDVKKATLTAPVPVDATRRLKHADDTPVIAGIKCALPSRGHLSNAPGPATLARKYEEGGTSAISVLTEGHKPLGGLDDFDKVRAVAYIPALRKDFIVIDYQIFETRAHNADLVLLTVAALNSARLRHLLDLAHELGMTTLVKTRTREGIERARKAGAKVIGINTRDLKNLKVDVNKYNELAADLPNDAIKVAKSGVFGIVKVEDYIRVGADAILIGEGVATTDNHELTVERLAKAGAQVRTFETTPSSEHRGLYWGQFGGCYVPEALIAALDKLERVCNETKANPGFHKEFMMLQQRYVGRPSPLTEVPRFSILVKEKTGLDARIFLRREDLDHTGVHKINNVPGQVLLVKRVGKARVIAETGAGQHSVATATVYAMLGLRCRIYMGQIGTRRQALNVTCMCMLGTEMVEVTLGDRVLKDATSEALRDWVINIKDMHYLLGTVAGPHPFPAMVRDFQKIIGGEAKQQFQDWRGIDHPGAIYARVGGSSDVIGVTDAFLGDERVNLYGYETGGNGPESGKHAIRSAPGTGQLGMLQGAKSYLLEADEGRALDTYPISTGLDYAPVGPEHVWFKDVDRMSYSQTIDEEAMNAFRDLSQAGGIVPAIESLRVMAGAHKATVNLKVKGYDKAVMIVNIPGRGDRDMATADKWFGYLTDDQAAAPDVIGTHNSTTA